MGDRKIASLGNKTPLEHAETPNMDTLAREGVCGRIDVLGRGVEPHSDDAHLTIFGYDLKKHYPGRGPIEAAGIGIKLMHGDVAMRTNLATVDKNFTVVDRRTGRIESTAPFAKDLDGMMIDGVRFIVKPGTAYRMIVIMRGKGLSDKITQNDPKIKGRKVLGIHPKDRSKEARFTAAMLTKFIEKSHKILKANPNNQKIKKEGKLEGNYLLVRGFGYHKKIPSFKEMYGLKACCIAGAGLYKGIGRTMGMKVIEVKGATGMPNTNVRAKFKAAKKALEDYDFVFVHVKPADSLSEDGNVKGKTEFIEKIDRELDVLMDTDAAIVITSDHSTPCELKSHSDDPVPFLINSKYIDADNVKKFGEADCEKGKFGIVRGKDFMNIVRKTLKF
ncbi:MAG: 2,3-bisphosphoglycerate-independent phosphoglycerate mutase [Candidatus Aenigmatarchaeota archaeon]|nr:MAG: 2,3-bisphosphoglycerate-independent phosphoglycerate mutase [Candidatus Aenigmarchaeota archaeon]